MGYFITLYPPTKPMIEETKILGTYKNELFGMESQKIQIITTEDILNVLKMNIPKSLEVEVL